LTFGLKSSKTKDRERQFLWVYLWDFLIFTYKVSPLTFLPPQKNRESIKIFRENIHKNAPNRRVVPKMNVYTYKTKKC